MNVQLQTLLQDSVAHYKARKLKKALNTAQIALEFGKEEGTEIEGIIQANLLLSRIYITNGRYQNDPSFFHKAINYIEEAEHLNDPGMDEIYTMSILFDVWKSQFKLEKFRSCHRLPG